MRILHTGDWHMNARLGTQKRGAEIIASLEQIAGYLHTQQVEVMIVAGDLFCDRCDNAMLSESVGEIKRIFGPFLANGGTILAISGNHDKDIFFATLNHALGLAPVPTTPNKLLPSGRLYPFHRPNIVRLTDRDGTIVQFLLMPYPKDDWLRGLEYDTSADQNRVKQDRFTQYLQKELVAKHLDITQPAVLVSHLLIAGTSTRAGYKMGGADNFAFAPTDIPDYLAYSAYGHIHQPQEAKANSPKIRYCGSVVRLDAGERADDKSVVLLDIGPEGCVGTPEILPLLTDPVVKIEFGADDDPDKAVADLKEKWTNHPDREKVLASVRLVYSPGTHAPETMRQDLHNLFPRLYECNLVPLRPDGKDTDNKGGTTALPFPLPNVAGNAIHYLNKKFGDDPRHEELLAALNELLGGGTNEPQEATS